jgi:hypothetical protein
LRTAGRPAGAAGAGEVPLVTVVVETGGQPLERVRAAVDSVLAAGEPDVSVLLVGPWRELSGGRVSVLADPALDLRLIAETYRCEPRVRLVEHGPDSAFPSPYLLHLPAAWALAPDAVGRMVEFADRQRLGLVRVGPASLWRTSAVSRARWVNRDGEPLAAVVAQVHGAAAVPAGKIGLRDLSGLTPAQFADGVPAAVLGGGRWLPATVEVAGFRSLLRATWVVARLAVHRLRHRTGSL